MSHPVVTVTVNQWNVKHNEENPDDPKPVICVSRYEYVDVTIRMGKVHREWGPQIGYTEHHYDFDIEANTAVMYDPLNKTPCGASCWIEYKDCYWYE